MTTKTKNTAQTGATTGRRRRSPKQTTTALMIGLVLFGLVFGVNIIRLHRNLPQNDNDPRRSFHSDMRLRGGGSRRRMEQSDQEQQQLAGAFWRRLQDQLEHRKIRCGVPETIVAGTNYSNSDNNHQTWDLVEAVRDYRNNHYDHNENDISCYIPSSCPLSVAEAKVAAVLVIDDDDIYYDKTYTLDCRQLLVACLKLLPIVEEVWVLISEKVWSTVEHSYKNMDSDELYCERFRQWQSQSHSRIHPLLVAENNGSWIAAVHQINSETMSPTIVWAEWKNLLPTKICWQTFVQRRVEEWRKIPMSLHISHEFRLSMEAKDKYDDMKHHPTSPFQNYCLPPEINNATKESLLSLQLETVVGDSSRITNRLLFPSIHGAVHNTAWLCYWAHPVVSRFLQHNDWNVVGFNVALWMAHLGGIQKIDVEEKISTTRVEAVSQLFGTMVESVKFFGGPFLPPENNRTVSQLCPV